MNKAFLLITLLLLFLLSCAEPENYWKDIEDIYLRGDLKKVEKRVLSHLKESSNDETEVAISLGYLGLVMLSEERVAYASEVFKKFRNTKPKKNQDAYNSLKARIEAATRNYDNELLVKIKQCTDKKDYIHPLLYYEQILLLEPQDDNRRKSYILYLCQLGFYDQAMSVARQDPDADRKGFTGEIMREQQKTENKVTRNYLELARWYWQLYSINKDDAFTRANAYLDANKSFGMPVRTLQDKWPEMLRSYKIINSIWLQGAHR
jgi:hypothetical protein